ncbi:MAG: DUF86 domain-containing protein [Granulosicoccus sp.]
MSSKSKNKDDSVYIEHILDCLHRIDEYVEGQEQFYSSHLVQDAVIRNLQVMAESSQRLSVAFKSRFAHIPWKALSGFRNILVHGYLGVDLDMIWSVVEQDLPALERTLSQFDKE